MVTRRQKEKTKARRTSAKSWGQNQESAFEPTCIRLPKEIELWKPSPGKHRVDFLPFVAGKHNRQADEGMQHFEATYEAHRIPTPDGSKLYACRNKCFGESCAVCDWLTRNGGHADPELVRSLRATTRHLWLVNIAPGEKKPVLRVFDTNHFNRGSGFGEQMAEILAEMDDDEDPFDPENGSTALLRVKELTWPGGKFNGVTRIDFRPRRHQYPADIAESMPCLDDCIIDPGYDEIMDMLESGGGKAKTKKQDPDDDEDDEDEDDEPEASKAKASRNGKVPAKGRATELGLEKGMTVEHPEHGECTISQVSSDGTTVRLKDADGNVHLAIDPDDCEILSEEEEEDEDEAPKAKRGQAKKGKPKDDEDEDEDDEIDEGDEDDEIDEGDDGDEDMEDDDEDEEDEDDEDEEPKPRRRSRR